MFARLMANKGLSRIMGLRHFGAAARTIGRGGREAYRGAYGAGKMYQAGMRGPAIGYGYEAGMGRMARGFRGMGRWATGAGYRGPGGRFGAIATRGGMMAGGAIAGGAALDFMNPWGLGWGD